MNITRVYTENTDLLKSSKVTIRFQEMSLFTTQKCCISDA